MSEESKQIPEPQGNDEATVSTTSAESSTKPKGKGKSEAKAEKKPTVNKNVIEAMLKANPALAAETESKGQKQLEETFKKLKLEDLLTGLAPTGKNQKDMASYKFWQTQPVPRFDESGNDLPDGPVKPENTEPPKEPAPLLDSFEWVTMDLTDEAQMTEVYELLSGHYVEDSEALFRFNYSPSFLNWALKAPGWHGDWHIGVRVKASKKLVAFISGIPVSLRVRDNTISCSEINFLCVHKKLRSKRLAPVLIKEITRRCNLKGIWSAVYTAGVILPTPISTCRYFHRSLNWLKLYEVNFTSIPTGTTKARQIAKFSLPDKTSTHGLRMIEKKDLEQVKSLLDRYLSRFDLAPVMDLEEVDHWLLHKEGAGDRIVWAYVVEDPNDPNKITDFFSFYSLESSVIGKEKHDIIKAAYLFYYASDTALQEGPDMEKKLKARLNLLVNDALILAKKLQFDVFNALTLLDNNMFLEEQKFGSGDGLLHYYMFNWRTKAIRGGLDQNKRMDAKSGSGVGLVML